MPAIHPETSYSQSRRASIICSFSTIQPTYARNSSKSRPSSVQSSECVTKGTPLLRLHTMRQRSARYHRCVLSGAPASLQPTTNAFRLTINLRRTRSKANSDPGEKCADTVENADQHEIGMGREQWPSTCRIYSLVGIGSDPEAARIMQTILQKACRQHADKVQIKIPCRHDILSSATALRNLLDWRIHQSGRRGSA